MKTLKFDIDIQASREKVWDVLWGKDSYPKWAAAFSEGSMAETDWEEGSKVLFMDSHSRSGMVSSIHKKKAPEYMEFKHLGVVENGVEDTESEKVKDWAGALETYTLTENNATTHLHVSCDTAEEYEKMFSDMWPNAMNQIKKLSEEK